MDTRKALGGKSKGFVSVSHFRRRSLNIAGDPDNSTSASSVNLLWLLFEEFVLFCVCPSELCHIQKAVHRIFA